mgnify:FL=1
MKPLLVILIVFAVGCAGKAPELTQYLLRTDTPGRLAEQAPASTGIGNLTVASYIDAPGLVLESGNGVVHAARHHQWADPLRESLRSFLASEISAATGRPIGTHSHRESNWKRRLDIHIDQLHGSVDGSARLAANWAVIDTTNHTVLAEHSFSETEPLSADGYDALVRAEKKLLSRLATAIAATLN